MMFKVQPPSLQEVERAAKQAAAKQRSKLTGKKTKAKELAVKGALPTVSSGAVVPSDDRMASVGGSLPAEAELRSWTMEAQTMFWQARWRHWDKKGLNVVQRAASDAGLWQGGDVLEIRMRLVMAEFAAGKLGPADWKVWRGLAGRWIEVEFDQGDWYLGYCHAIDPLRQTEEEPEGVSSAAADGGASSSPPGEVLLQWETGEEEWVGGLKVRHNANPALQLPIGLPPIPVAHVTLPPSCAAADGVPCVRAT